MIRTSLKKIRKQGLLNLLMKFCWRIPLVRNGFKHKTIHQKWLTDAEHIPLTKEHYPLYEAIHIDQFIRLGSFPNLRNLETFNNKIQWLKLFDQTALKIKCADKLGLREYIEKRIGPGYLPKLYFFGKSLNQSAINELPNSFALKTNHDSGSVFLIRQKPQANWAEIIPQLESSLTRTYGEKYGEWMYKHISPMVFAEELLGSSNDHTPPADYKFHCSSGRVNFLQYIWDRGGDTKEVITDRSGSVMKGVHLDENFTLGNKFEIPHEFSSLVEVSESLAKGFKYVRIDLYLISGKIYVGEMTFLPFRGCYSGEGQKQLGKLLSFDTTAIPIFTT